VCGSVAIPPVIQMGQELTTDYSLFTAAARRTPQAW
jgi:hypothetical protein